MPRGRGELTLSPGLRPFPSPTAGPCVLAHALPTADRGAGVASLHSAPQLWDLSREGAHLPLAGFPRNTHSIQHSRP